MANNPHLGYVRPIDDNLMIETLLYEIEVDKAVILFQAKGTPITYKEKLSSRTYGNPTVYTLYRINAVYESSNKTIKLLVLENGMALFLSSKEIHESWRGVSVSEEDNKAYTKTNVGLRIFTITGSKEISAHFIVDIPDDELDKVLLWWEEANQTYETQFQPYLSKDHVKEVYRKWKITKDYERFKTDLRKKEETEAIQKHFKLQVKERPKASPRASHYIQIEVEAIDGNKYYLECEGRNWTSDKWGRSAVMRLEDWHELVFTPKDHVNLKDYIQHKMEEFIGDLVRGWNYFIYGVNGKKVTVVVKSTPDKTKNDAIIRRFYINDIFCPQDMMVSILISLRDKTIKEVLAQTKVSKEIPDEAQKMIKNGLIGQFHDLEGWHTFKINVLRKGRNYFLELSGKEFPVDGGFAKLIPLQTSLEGKSNTSHEMYQMNINSCRDFRWILHRLGEIIGRENAMWVLIEMKKVKPSLQKGESGDD